MKFHIFATKGDDDELLRDEADTELEAWQTVDRLEEDGYDIEDVLAMDEDAPEAQRGWRLPWHN
jgi:hypothetical protein